MSSKSKIVVFIALLALAIVLLAPLVWKSIKFQVHEHLRAMINSRIASAKIEMQHKQYSAAATNLLSALPLVEREAPKSDLLERNLMLLGHVEIKLGDYNLAISALKEALPFAKAKAPSDPTDLILITNHLTEAFDDAGDYYRAVPYIKLGLSQYERAPQDNQVGIARELARLSSDEETADPRDSVHQDRGAIRLFEAAKWPKTWEIANTIADLANGERFLGDFPSARRDAANAIEMDEARYGKTSSWLIHPLAVYALVNDDPQHARAGAQAADQEFTIFEHYIHSSEPSAKRMTKGAKNRGLVDVVITVTRLYATEGKSSQALAIYDLLVKEFKAKLSTDDLSLAYLLWAKGAFLRDHVPGRNADAEKCFTQALAIYKANDDHNGFYLTRARLEFALLLTYEHRFREAIPLYKKGLPEIEWEAGKPSLERATLLGHLAVAEAGDGDLQAAIATEKRALDFRKAQLPPGNRLIAESNQDLDWILKRNPNAPVPRQPDALYRL